MSSPGGTAPESQEPPEERPPARDPSPPVQNWLGSFLPSVLPPTHQGPASLDPTPAPQRAEDLQRAGTTQGNRGPAPPQEHHAHWVKPFTPAVLKPRLMSTDCVPGPGGLSTWWGLGRDPPRPAVGTMGTINQSEAGRAAPGSSLLCGLGQAGLGSQAGGGRGSNIRSGADQTLPQSSRCCCSREGWPYLWPAWAESHLPSLFPSLSQQLLPTASPHLPPPTGPTPEPQ